MNQKTYKYSMISVLAFSLTSLSLAASNTSIKFSDSFETALPYKVTECGFFDKETQLTWSKLSYDCSIDKDSVCIDKAKTAIQQENANCVGKTPTLAQLLSLIDQSKNPKSKIPNAAANGVTIGLPLAQSQHVGVEFGEGKIKVYDTTDKRYARLVISS